MSEGGFEADIEARVDAEPGGPPPRSDGRGMSGARRHPVAVAVVKTVHTAVFLVELAAIGWLVVTGILGRRNRTVALAASAVAAETAVFLANDGVCPLTPLTERLGATKGAVSDIFLPDVVARTIPIWSSALIALAVLLHARSALQGRGTTGPPGTGALALARRGRLAAYGVRRDRRFEQA